MSGRSICIGGASGFWGDSSIAVPQLLGHPGLQYLVFDYLAEITMSILARARARDPNSGYATDFVSMLESNIAGIAERGVKVVANAGGVNPIGCGRAIEAMLERTGHSLKVAVVTGDDVLPLVPQLREAGICDMFTGAAFPEDVLSANAYLGAFPVAAALDAGADIVVTGRCVDAAMTLGPCIHAFGWGPADLDQLAGGALAGHIIECGAQASGGIHTDWERTGDWANIGYPVADVGEDGSCIITKPELTGGLVSYGTVAEQILYEIGDPEAYLLPDVTCNFTQVRVEELGPNKVRVRGARGCEPTDSYKVSITYALGFRVGMYLTVGGIDAVRKAQKVGEAVLHRCARLLAEKNQPPFEETSIEVIGSESLYGPFSRAGNSREVILKVAAKHSSPGPLSMLVRELTSSGTSMAPGITSMGGNRPKVSPVVQLFSCTAPKSAVTPMLEIGGRSTTLPGARAGAPACAHAAQAEEPAPVVLSGGVAVPLVALAWARSGDKGNNANIGVIARDPAFLPYISAAVTEKLVAERFAHLLKGRVQRFAVPGINAFNFLMHDALGGGGIASLRNDPQGKTYAQVLLDVPVMVPAELAARLDARTTPAGPVPASPLKEAHGTSWSTMPG